MSNTDLINAYFGNEMTDVERQDFEARLQSDPELKSEFDFQKEIVDAIKEARRADLKAMLDKVPVGGGSSGGAVSVGKVVSTLVIAGLVGFGIYYMWPNDKTPVDATTEVTMAEPVEDAGNIEPDKPQPKENESVISEDKPKVTTESKDEEKAKITDEPLVTEVTPSEPEINKPTVAPTFETSDEQSDSLEAPGSNLVSKSYDDHAALDVEVDNTNKNFTFHYQFKSGKLFLYGSFDKGLYEILEINSRGEKTLFLFYKDKFYPLNKNQVRIVPLDPVRESSLIEKLMKARVEG